MNQSNPVIEEDDEMLKILADSAVDFCQRNLEVTRLRELRERENSFDSGKWGQICELGWAGLVVPEELGGAGLGAVALDKVCRQMGRVVAPEPLLECGIGSVGVLSKIPGAADLLGDVMKGKHLIGTALTEPEEFADVRGSEKFGGRTRRDCLSGYFPCIPLAYEMDSFIIRANSKSSDELYLVPANTPGLTLTTKTLSDGGIAGDLTLENVNLGHVRKIALGDEAESALTYGRDLSRIAASSYLVGLAEGILDITLDYLKTRQQFGKPIGSFQSLQHRAVDLYIKKVLAISCLEESCRNFDYTNTTRARSMAASRAKYRATETALQCARQAVQMHGGIGYTDECSVGLYLNRALVIAAWLGNSGFHARKLTSLFSQNKTAQKTEVETTTIPCPETKNWEEMSDDEFRSAARGFFEQRYPEEMRYPSRRHRWSEIKDWYMTLSNEGWVAPSWPREHGGMGLSPSKLLVYIEEQERWGVGRAPDMGITMVGPLLIQHGTPQQQKRYLPKILAGEEIWCQGYSEPNSGSDLASLKTAAIRDGDEFVINGQKTWTTLAQDATHMFCLARTAKDGKPQEGISFFLIDFKQPGVTIRPIRNIAGHEEFCEVFLDNVRVPADCLVGQINRGWTIAKALLGFERIFLGSPKQSQFALMRLEEIAKSTGKINDPQFAESLTLLKIDVLDLIDSYQHFADIVRRGESLGPEVSLLKIWATETFSKITEVMIETAGAEGATIGNISFGDSQIDVMSQFYNARPATIYGGSNEIQRNILSKAVLGLPSA